VKKSGFRSAWLYDEKKLSPMAKDTQMAKVILIHIAKASSAVCRRSG